MHSASPLSVLAVSISDAARRLGISKASLYRIIEQDDSFPKVKPVGKRCKRISLAELEVWFDTRQGAKNAQPK